LIRHIQKGWSFLRGEFGEFVELMPAAQQRLNESWYEGTADAVAQNINILRSHKPEFILILAGDHIYKMDYGTMIAKHVEQKADMTVGCLEVPLEMAKGFGVMSVGDDGRIVRFTEKPAQPEPTPNVEPVALYSHANIAQSILNGLLWGFMCSMPNFCINNYRLMLTHQRPAMILVKISFRL
jgi:glucose-1-phosphate adenylyltransferase